MHSTHDDLLQRALGSRYVLERELGRGGWATVYLARDTKHDRLVAIKTFRPELAHSLGTGRFLQEIRLVAQFQHPHILPLHDSGEALHTLYYVTPYVEGESLRDMLRREGRLPVEDAVRVAREVASALDYAHRHGVVHRDIKPENILLSDGHAVVADFGIARAVQAAQEQRLSHPGVAVGTPAYMAPEQALGGGGGDARGDVFSLGVVLYEMLAGETPFNEVSVQGIVARVKRGSGAPSLAAKRTDVPDTVAAAVDRALEADPDARFQSAREFSDALAPGLTPVTGTWATWTATPRARRLRWPLAALALAVAAGVGIWQLATPEAPSRPGAVVVLPFEMRGAEEYAYLGDGMVDLLTTNLDGAGDLRAVDARAVLGTLGEGREGMTTERGDAIARRLGAELYVLGNIVEAGGRLRVQAALWRRGASQAPLAQASAEGAATRLFEVVDEIATELVAGVRTGPGERLVRLAAVSTRSLPALKAYLEGEAHLRAGRADSAVEAFGRATAADSLFALAYYRQAVAADWAAQFAQSRVAVARAIALGSRLAPGDRRLLHALQTMHGGDAEGAEREYRAILRDDPENVEAWYQLGEVIFHLGGVHGRPLTESREAFSRALHFDPKNGDALFHLLDVAGREGRFAEYDSLLAMAATGESNIVLRRRAVRAFALGDAAERDAVLAELRRAGDGTVVVAAGQVATYVLDFDAASRIAAFLAEPSRPAATQAFGHRMQAQLALGGGRPSGVSPHLRRMAAIDPGGALVASAALAMAPHAGIGRAGLVALRDSLVAWPAHAEPEIEGGMIVSVHNGVMPLLREYLVALLSARIGDTTAARRGVAALRSAGAPAHAGTLASDLAAHVEAELLQRAGRPADALRALEAIRSFAPLERLANSEFYGGVAARLLRGELLLQLNRPLEARRWFAAIGEGRYDFAWLAPAQLGVARAAEQSGDAAGARAAYARFARLWRSPDAALRPLADDARRRAGPRAAGDAR